MARSSKHKLVWLTLILVVFLIIEACQITVARHKKKRNKCPPCFQDCPTCPTCPTCQVCNEKICPTCSACEDLDCPDCPKHPSWTNPDDLKCPVCARTTVRSNNNSKLRCGDYIPLKRNRRVHDRTGYGETPFLVSLDAVDPQVGETFNCSGALLNRKTVLTSAKCALPFSDFSDARIKLRIGHANYERALLFDVIDGHSKASHSSNSDCSSGDIMHGLSYLTLDREVELKLETKKQYTNTICPSDIYGTIQENRQQLCNKTLVALMWMRDDKCSKYIPIRLKNCKESPKNRGDELEMEKETDWLRLETDKVQHERLQEGSVVAYLEDDFWHLAGILSKETDIHNGCEGVESSEMGKPRLILFNHVINY